MINQISHGSIARPLSPARTGRAFCIRITHIAKILTPGARHRIAGLVPLGVVLGLAVLTGIGFTVALLIGEEEETRDDDADGIPGICRRTSPGPAGASGDG
jgi:hypothetical protein